MNKKFRIWGDQKFFYAKEKPYLDSAYNSLIFKIEDGIVWGDEGEITIQQWTGLLDSTGKEIYEGDIVKAGAIRGVVSFEKGAFFVGDEILFNAYVLLAGQIVVTGNVHENNA